MCGTQNSDFSQLPLKQQGLTKLASAYEAHGSNEDQDERLAEAARLLRQTYQEGAKEPEVVWPLMRLWTDTGHLERVVVLLKDYLAAIQDPEEKFLASHYIVDSYAMMRAHDEAVEHHQDT